MASNTTPSLSVPKTVNTSPQLPSPSYSQAPVTLGHESFSQRRNGGIGSSGHGTFTRGTNSAARSNQPFRKQHKSQRRPQLASEDTAAESAAIRSTSSRKGQTSITHLMNFTLPPRPQSHQHSSHSRYPRRPTWGLGSGHHSIDKARYIHANYRFIVDPRENYRAQATDANVHLDWNNVLQILVSDQSQASSCPICLSTPVAPRMAKCGHIFCLPCLIRYMHSTDDKAPVPEKKARWKKCPICWDSVYLSETRPVRWFSGQEGEPPREGGDVVLRLMMRSAGSTLALPRDGAEALSANVDIPWYYAAEVLDYARVMKGGEDYMTLHFDREINELQHLEKEDELIFGEDAAWTRKAVGSIREAKERVKGMGNPPLEPIKPDERKMKRPPIKFNNALEDGVPGFYSIQHAAKSGQSIPRSFVSPDSYQSQNHAEVSVASTTIQPQPLLSSSDPPVRKIGRDSGTEYHPSEESHYYFYQALLHYYLSPLDIRILKAAFGEFSSFPTTILPRVERISTGHIIDDDLRRRAKYLSHLPDGCEVGFLECNWTDVVAPEVLQGFRADIERRRKKNNEKEIREEKERLRAEKTEEEKRWAAARRKKPSIVRDHSADTVSLAIGGSQAAFQSSSSLDLSTPSSSPLWLSTQDRKGSAFASLASPSTSPVAPRTVWGTRAIVPTSPSLEPEHHEQEIADNDGWLQGWERDLLIDDDLAMRLRASSVQDDDSTKLASTPGTMKKKKAKKITLMTTNARRAA